VEQPVALKLLKLLNFPVTGKASDTRGIAANISWKEKYYRSWRWKPWHWKRVIWISDSARNGGLRVQNATKAHTMLVVTTIMTLMFAGAYSITCHTCFILRCVCLSVCLSVSFPVALFLVERVARGYKICHYTVTTW